MFASYAILDGRPIVKREGTLIVGRLTTFVLKYWKENPTIILSIFGP